MCVTQYTQGKHRPNIENEEISMESPHLTHTLHGQIIIYSVDQHHLQKFICIQKKNNNNMCEKRKGSNNEVNEFKISNNVYINALTNSSFIFYYYLLDTKDLLMLLRYIYICIIPE